MRPLIEAPSWDGKIVLAGFLIVGYYALVLTVVVGTPAGDLTPVRAGVVRDALLTLGPPIGLVFGALFRSTAAEERTAALRSADLQTALHAPSAPAAPSAAAIGAKVEQGARDGAREGVEAGLSGEPAPADSPAAPAGTHVIT